MSSSPKQPYQAQIDALSERFDRQDEQFDLLESKLDQLIRAFEKSPMPDQTNPSPHIAADFMVRGCDRRKWLMYKSGHPEESESEEPEPLLHSRRHHREQGSNWRHGEKNPRGRRIDTSGDDRRSGNYRDPRNTDRETDRRNVHEGYSDILLVR